MKHGETPRGVKPLKNRLRLLMNNFEGSFSVWDSVMECLTGFLSGARLQMNNFEGGASVNGVNLQMDNFEGSVSV